MSQCSEFLTLHANGLLVTPKKAFKSPLKIEILQMYAADKDLAAMHAIYIHSREFLYIPVHKSPLLVALIPRPWHYRYTTSYNSLSMLWSIIETYTTLLGIKRDKLIIESDELDDKMFKTLEADLNEEQFLEVMRKLTIEKIQLHERFIHGMFDYKFPVEYILTPFVFPKIEMLQEEDRKEYDKRMGNYFEEKNKIMNSKLEKATPEGEYIPKNFFPNKGWSNLEYYKFLKINE